MDDPGTTIMCEPSGTCWHHPLDPVVRAGEQQCAFLGLRIRDHIRWRKPGHEPVPLAPEAQRILAGFEATIAKLAADPACGAHVVDHYRWRHAERRYARRTRKPKRGPTPSEPGMRDALRRILSTENPPVPAENQILT